MRTARKLLIHTSSGISAAEVLQQASQRQCVRVSTHNPLPLRVRSVLVQAFVWPLALSLAATSVCISRAIVAFLPSHNAPQNQDFATRECAAVQATPMLPALQSARAVLQGGTALSKS
jgi:hypothetical protein